MGIFLKIKNLCISEWSENDLTVADRNSVPISIIDNQIVVEVGR